MMSGWACRSLDEQMYLCSAILQQAQDDKLCLEDEQWCAVHPEVSGMPKELMLVQKK